MSIEEQAEEYEMDCIADVYRDDVCTIPYAYSAQKLEQAFQDGAKWGMEHAIEWHEIKRCSKDLPPRSEDNNLHSVFVSNEYGEPIYYNYFTAKWYDIEGDEVSEVYKYWCELPTYKE